MNSLKDFNTLPPQQAFDQLFRCCSSRKWAREMMAHFPFTSESDLKLLASKVWFSLAEADWLEAFLAHPKIGENLDLLKERFRRTHTWSQQEQAKLQGASEEILLQIQEGNRKYIEKFGFVFLICATGKSAEQMLKALQQRLHNTRDEELKNAAKEQDQITQLRIAKMLKSEESL